MNNDTFRTNFRSLIYNHGMTARSFASTLGISNATVSRYLGGQRTPDISHIIKISEYFNVSIDWLLGCSNNNIPSESQELLNKYYLASDTDKFIIQTILNKYE